MKLLHLIASADLVHGGPIEHALRMGEVLERRGHRQEFMTIDPPGMPSLEDFPAPLFTLGRKRDGGGGRFARLTRWINYAPDAVPWLRRHLKDYDAVIVSGLWNYSTLAARRALVGGPTPYVVFPHGMLDPWFKRAQPAKAAVKQALWPFSEGPLLANADFVLFTCEEERQLARKSFAPYRVRERVVAFGTGDAPAPSDAQRDAFAAAVPMLGNRPYLLYLSRIHEKKGVDLLVQAYARIAEQDAPDLVIAGPDPNGLKPALEAMARDGGCADRIHWPGMLRGDAKWGAFRGTQAFILPSHQENFGIVVAEAMACAKPVLISNKVNIWREVAGERAGLVEDDTVEGTERLLRGLLAMPESDRLAMGNRARTAFERHFHIDQAVDDFERVLADLPAVSAARN